MNAAHGVDDHQRGERQPVTEVERRAALSAFHRALAPQRLPHGRARSRADAALRLGVRGRGEGGGVALGGSGADGAVADAQVEDDGGGHDGHDVASDAMADAALFEEAHHAVRRAEAVGAASAEDDGVHERDRVFGAQEVGLPRAGGCAANVNAADGALERERDGAAGAVGGVGAEPDGDAGGVRERAVHWREARWRRPGRVDGSGRLRGALLWGWGSPPARGRRRVEDTGAQARPSNSGAWGPARAATRLPSPAIGDLCIILPSFPRRRESRRRGAPLLSYVSAPSFPRKREPTGRLKLCKGLRWERGGSGAIARPPTRARAAGYARSLTDQQRKVGAARALRAASCSASAFLRPSPAPASRPSTSTRTANGLPGGFSPSPTVS